SVFRKSAAVGGGGETRVPPGPGPFFGRVDLVIAPGFLVGDQGAVVLLVRGRLLVTGAPVHLVAGQVLQVDAGIPGLLDVLALRSRPVFVVSYGEEDLVVLQQLAVPVRVHAGEITDVVAVALEEAYQRIFGTEVEIAGFQTCAGGERPVVA